jgi:hypothetical protein
MLLMRFGLRSSIWHAYKMADKWSIFTGKQERTRIYLHVYIMKEIKVPISLRITNDSQYLPGLTIYHTPLF